MITKIENLEKLQLLLVGNNPIELSKILDRLNEVKGGKINTAFAFDLKSSLQCLLTFKPSHILIDDNIGKSELSNSINRLQSRRKTKDIPITILKNSNYQETVSWGALNFILKSNLTGELLYRSLLNSSKYRRAQLYFQQAYRKRKGQLSRMLQIS